MTASNKSEPFFSVVVASYLGYYTGAALHRREKFYRAIDSVLNQSFKDYEIIIVSDGCEMTNRAVQLAYLRPEVKLVKLPKQRIWSAKVRNAGIAAATGKYITYLDTDDKFGADHLKIIAEQITGFDWVWYDDYVMDNKYRPVLYERELVYGKCGTSNITHKRDIKIRWNDSTYRHDWKFIQQFFPIPTKKITAPEYIVCHVPKTRGYEQHAIDV